MNDQNEVSVLSRTTRRQLMLGATAAFGSAVVIPGGAWAADEGGVSHSAEAIHQEPVFQSGRKRVFEALTKADQFERRHWGRAGEDQSRCWWHVHAVWWVYQRTPFGTGSR